MDGSIAQIKGWSKCHASQKGLAYLPRSDLNKLYHRYDSFTNIFLNLGDLRSYDYISSY